MEPKNKDYVLVLEDRTAVKDKQEVGKLSVVSGIDGQGNLKTSDAAASTTSMEETALTSLPASRITPSV